MTEQTTSDAELVAAWLAGDKPAFAAIYDRYADGLYAFAMSRLRNHAEAADVVQETFVRAAARLTQLRDRSRLRAWLYAIARNRVIDARRRPMSYVDAEEFAEMPADQPELADVAARSELAELVWLAADGLTPRDRELLGLHLRHGLDGADLADVVGVTPANLYVSMNRLKERMAKAVGALLIARHGSKDCPELSALLAGWDGTFSLDVRAKVTRHVEGCAECTTRRAALITTASFSAGALAVPFIAPAHIRAATLGELDADARVDDGGHGGDRRGGDRRRDLQRDGWRADGFPAVHRRPRRTASALVVTAASCAVLIAATVLYVSADRGERRVLSPAADASNTTIAEVPRATALEVEEVAPPAVSQTAVATTVVDTTVTPPSAAATTTSFGPVILDAVGAMHTPTPTPAPTSPLQPGPTVPGLATPPASSPTLPAAPEPTVPNIAPPAQTTVPTTDSTAVATTVAVATTPPPPPAPPGRIVLIANPIIFDVSQVTATARLRNDGGQSAGWSAAAGLAAFSVSPSSGSLAPGESIDIQISVDRAGLAEGTPRTDVVVTSAGGGGSVSVEARVERAPIIGPLNRTPPLVRNSNSCGPTLVNVSITASDESGIASVEVLWSSDGSFAQRTALAPNGAGAYLGTIGSFSKLGTNNFTAHVLDTRGNASTAAASVVVLTC